MLMSPENNAVESALTQTFTWTEPEAGVTYDIQIDSEATFTSPYVHEDNGLTDNSYIYTFASDGVYYWRVRAVDAANNQSSWADNFEFTIPILWRGTATLKLENLYAVRVDKDLQLHLGSKLVVKFYTYGDAFENENIIKNFSLPAYVEENEVVPHPQGEPVKKARLDLTTDNTENVISTIAIFTVRKIHLEARFIDIPFYWSMADAAGKLEIETEFMEIPFYWSGAPD